MEGKIRTVQYARENRIPYLGICLGMQVAVIEFARNVLGLEGANSSEFAENSPHPVVGLITEWITSEGAVEQRDAGSDLGGTMRLGAQACHLVEGSSARGIYGAETIMERHRHRYEVNNAYREQLEKDGLVFSGMSPDGLLPEIVERPDHPWFVGVQSHPELKSRPFAPHPLFAGFVGAALEQALDYAVTLDCPRLHVMSGLVPDGVSRVTRSGNQLTLSPRVKFESGGTVIVAESLRSVDELARVLKENDAIIKQVELIGYTDDRGNDAKNLALSEKRAGAVRQALTDRGVDSSKLTSTGRGEENPITTNKTAAGRELNRRVEVNITLESGK